MLISYDDMDTKKLYLLILDIHWLPQIELGVSKTLPQRQIFCTQFFFQLAAVHACAGRYRPQLYIQPLGQIKGAMEFFFLQGCKIQAWISISSYYTNFCCHKHLELQALKTNTRCLHNLPVSGPLGVKFQQEPLLTSSV